MIKVVLKSRKAETLIESLISIMILSILLVTVTLTIVTALRITGQSTDGANRAQGTVNELVAGTYGISASNALFTMSFAYTFLDESGDEILGETGYITSSHNVVTAETDGYRAFRPD
jgi:hypothetical protein